MYFIKWFLIGLLLFGTCGFIIKKNPNIWKTAMNRIENAKNRTICFGLFGGMILTQCWQILGRKYPTSADEVYTIANAMFFGGYDVSEWMHLKKYYNFGYTMFMAPLYEIFENPVTILRMMLFLNLIVHALMVVLAYCIATKYFHTSKRIGIAFALASACNTLLLYFRGFMYNEVPLALVHWLTVLFLLMLVDANGKKRYLVSALMGILMAYAYFVHSRCLIIYIALAMVVVLYLLVYRKFIIQPILFVIGYLPVYFAGDYLLGYVKENVYLVAADAVMTNSVEQVAGGTGRFALLTTIGGIGKFIAQLFSFAGTVTIETGGILTIATVMAIYYLVKNFKKLCKGQENKHRFVLAMFTTLSCWGMIAAITLVGAAGGKVRFLTYSRYIAPFIGAFLLFGMLLLKNRKEYKLKWIIVWSTVINLCVAVSYAFYAYPILKGNNMAEVTSSLFFKPFSLWSGQLRYTRGVLALMLLVLMVVMVLIFVLCKRRQYIAVSMLLFLFSVSLWGAVEDCHLAHSSQRRYYMCDAVNELYDSGMLEGKNVMCVSEKKFKNMLFFSLYEEDLIYDEELFVFDENSVMVSVNRKPLKQYKPEYIYELDENEYIGVWDKDPNNEFAQKYKLVVK